jgi:hypothetical protein
MRYRGTPEAMRVRLGVDPRSCHPIRWLVVNEGAAAVTRDRPIGLTIAVSPGALTAKALDAVGELVLELMREGRAAEPVGVKFYENGAWRTAELEGAVAALAAIDAARRRANTVPSGSFVMAEEVSEETIRRTDERMYALWLMHRICNGELRGNLVDWLVAKGLLDYVMLSSYEASKRSHVVKHIGRHIDYNGSEWATSAIGRGVEEEVVDPVYGKFTVASLRGVEAERKPVKTGVDIALNTPDGMFRTRYVRVLLPFVTPDGRALILGASSYQFARNPAA